MCALDVRGAADGPISASTLGRRKHPSIRLSKKTTQAWARRVSGGWFRRRSADSEALSAQLAWIRIFGVLRSYQKCRFLEFAGREAEMRQIGREKAEFLWRCTQKILEPCLMYCVFVYCSNECDMQVVSIFLIVGCLGFCWSQLQVKTQAVRTQKVVNAVVEGWAPQFLF